MKTKTKQSLIVLMLSVVTGSALAAPKTFNDLKSSDELTASDSKEVKENRKKCYFRIEQGLTNVDANVKACQGWSGRVEIVNTRKEVVQNVAIGCKFYTPATYRKDEFVIPKWADAVDNKIADSNGILGGGFWMCASGRTQLKFTATTDFDSWKAVGARLKLDGIGDVSSPPPLHYSAVVIDKTMLYIFMGTKQ